MKYTFGEKIRSVRERRGMTMKEVAEKAGVSESLISQIERNKVSPAIDTLLSIAENLGIDLEYLFSNFRKERSVNLVKAAERAKMEFEGVSYERLSQTGSGNGEDEIEAYLLEIAPGCEKGDMEYGHIGKELGVIIDGSGEFVIGSKNYPLHKGDSLSFEADIPHVLKNTGKKALKAFWVVTPPKGITAK